MMIQNIDLPQLLNFIESASVDFPELNFNWWLPIAEWRYSVWLSSRD